ncbi:hypothetical protein GCM10010277_32190 [Streptomyces longisporoflavus]|uniref:hypothetical protein n=1 Tax=Streptomyces longisporoflavus TaxID=28044 RepID=UPI0019943661|nr:hypothetical protein [Streptomyces longisporoflavus]GGV42897.1 hypothetical protein GCM10010277_32190 [Streptomyces longisporoflavus]
MNRPLRLATPALAMSAALLLASCGSSDDESKDSDKIAGAGQEAKKTPSPSASKATDAERPEIKLPSDLHYKFEWSKTGDESKDAVLSDTEQYVKAVDMAIAEQDALHKSYRYYSEGEAAAGSQKFIKEFIDFKNRITGTKRFYNARVDVTGGNKAALVYCEDQGKAFNKSLKTGKTDVTSPSKDDLVVYSSRLHLNKQGVWITEQTTSERGSAACQSS